jgi:hypothetical protein
MVAAMNGLISEAPSPPAVRLALGGALLLVVQSAVLLLAPELGPDLRLLIWVLTPIAIVALILSLIGFPDPPPDQWRRRNGR